MVVAGLGLLLAVRRHLGPIALGGVWRALLVLLVAAAIGAAAGLWLPWQLGLTKTSFLSFSDPALNEVPFDGGAFAADLCLGLAFGLLAAVVTAVVAVLLDRDLRGPVGVRVGKAWAKLQRKFSRNG